MPHLTKGAGRAPHVQAHVAQQAALQVRSKDTLSGLQREEKEILAGLALQ